MINGFIVTGLMALGICGQLLAADITGVCRHVVDGDSLYIQGEKRQIRLWGVDAPERDEKGYRRATHNLKRLALHQQLRCKPVDTDKYNRIVARCFTGGKKPGQSVVEINREQIRLAEVNEYCYFSRNHYGQCASKPKNR